MSRGRIAQARWAALLLSLSSFTLSKEGTKQNADGPEKTVALADAKDGATPDDDQKSATQKLATPRVRATVIGPNPSYLGQMVQVEVELLRDNRAENQPAAFFPEVHVRGAIVLLSESAPPPEVRKEGEVEFLVQKRRYLVFPQSQGKLTVPPIRLSLPGPDGRSQDVSTEPFELRADVPKGAGSRLPLIARNVTLKREIAGDLDSLRVGDAVTISLRISAEDTDALLLPRMARPELDGLSRYPGEARSQTESSRGVYRAERVDSATYVASAWGFYELPRHAVFWLDPTTGDYAEATVPALSFRVRTNPSLGTGCLGDPAATRRFGATLGGLGLLVVLLTRSARRFAARRRKLSRVDRTPGERAAFRTLVRALRSAGDASALTALYRWLRFVDRDLVTLAAFRETTADPNMEKPLSELESRVATGAGPGAPVDLLPPLTRYRKRARKGQAGAAGLPRLN